MQFFILMVIRTGILCIPDVDDAAIAATLNLLQTNIATILLLETAAARNQRNWIEDLLCRWCDEEELDLLVTIGGTAPAPGPGAAEIVPEATAAVVDRLLPGVAEAMRSYAAEESTLAWLDRSVAGIRGRSLLLNLPAGAGPALLFLEAVIDLIEPLLLFLHEPNRAPRLADVITITSIDPTAAEPQPTAIGTTPSGLNADDFAAFLERRSKQ
ncbi:MAG: molybdopterin-binding protein [Caldilineaceae bacterium]